MKKSDIATLKIQRVIFHDVPVKHRAAQPKTTLSDAETAVDPVRQRHLREKLVKVLRSKTAYDVYFSPVPGTSVPTEVRAFTALKHGEDADAFVTTSQALANQLFAQQPPSASDGLLCVMAGTVGGYRAMAVMKLEREAGARLELEEKDGKKTYSMMVLDDLVLTTGTRLFKTAMFVRVGDDDDDFQSTVCDEQSLEDCHPLQFHPAIVRELSRYFGLMRII